MTQGFGAAQPTETPEKLTRVVAIAAATALATFITALDNTIVNVALPTIQRDLALSRIGLEWIVTAYIVTFAGLMFLGGRLCDRYDRRTVFVWGIALFMSASVVAVVAQNLVALIVARALQGVGAALMQPAALSILGAELKATSRHIAVGASTIAAAVALAAGPLLGGLITEQYRWQGIFVVNVPVGLACIALVMWSVGPASPREREGAMGLPGVLSSGIALTSLVWVLIEAGPHGWTAVRVIVGWIVFAVSTTWFIHLARTGRATIADATLVRNPRYVGSLFASLLWGLGISGVSFFTSLYLQNVLGMSPVAAGAMFVPLTVMLMVGVAFVGIVVKWIGEASTVGTGLLVLSAGLLWVSLMGADATSMTLLPGLLLVGFGSGLTVPVTSIALGAVDESRMGMASSLITTVREISAAFGIALIGLLVTFREAVLQNRGFDDRLAFLGGYQWGLQAAALLTVVGAVVSFIMLRERQS